MKKILFVFLTKVKIHQNLILKYLQILLLFYIISNLLEIRASLESLDEEVSNISSGLTLEEIKDNISDIEYQCEQAKNSCLNSSSYR